MTDRTSQEKTALHCPVCGEFLRFQCEKNEPADAVIRFPRMRFDYDR